MRLWSRWRDFPPVGGGFPGLMQSRTREAVSCRDSACGGVFDSGYVQARVTTACR